MALQELDYDHNVFSGHGQSQPGDEKLFVKFYMHFLEDREATEKAGRPIYTDCEFVRIVTPGDRNNIVDRPVRPTDKVRFSKQYTHYQQHGSQAVVGTVLEEWPLASKSMVENLKTMGFHTVEQLAEARDDIVLSHPGLMGLRDRAKNYLQVAAGNAPITRLETELTEQKNQREVLERQVAELSAKVEELTAKKK